MTRLFLIITFLYSSTIIFGQSISWVKVSERSNRPEHIMQAKNGDFILSGNALSRYSINGDLLWNRENSLGHLLYSTELDDGRLLHLTARDDIYISSSDSTTLNLVFDLENAINGTHAYRANQALKQNGKLYILGQGLKYNNRGIFFHVIDLTSLALLESSFYTGLEFEGFTILNDDARILYDSSGKIVKIDAAGNVFWETNLGETVEINKIVANKEYLYVIGGKEDIDDDDKSKAFIAIMDKRGAFISRNEYIIEEDNGYYTFASIVFLSNGDFICGGSYRNTSSHGASLSYISASGIRKWTLQDPILENDFQTHVFGAVIEDLILQEDDKLLAVGRVGYLFQWDILELNAFFFGVDDLTAIAPRK